MRRNLYSPFAGLMLLLGGLQGCGSSQPPAATTNVSTTTSTLNNTNWSLAGTRAAGDYTVLAAIFTVNGSTISATASDGGYCGDSAEGLTGQISSDGSFTLQQLAPSDPVLSITGKAPPSAGGVWSGSYTITSLSAASKCYAVPATTFTARPISSLTGTYAGTTTSGSLGTGITLKMQVIQGLNLQYQMGISTAASFPVTGNITIANSACFTTGTLDSTSYLIGDTLYGTLNMNDGSSVSLVAYMGDPSGATLEIQAFIVNGGKCNGQNAFANLARQ